MVAILSTTGYTGVVIRTQPAREEIAMLENLKRRATDCWERVPRFLARHGVIG